MGRGHTDTHTDTHAHGHRDSMIESAQWADSMKNGFIMAYIGHINKEKIIITTKL